MFMCVCVHFKNFSNFVKFRGDSNNIKKKVYEQFVIYVICAYNKVLYRKIVKLHI